MTCPWAETIVRRTVIKALARDPGLAARLIRMHFHDCFVRGCDASVLLDSIPGQPSEKESSANNPSLRGFEVIDEAKAEVQDRCPNTVSCSDILAFAARDSVCKFGLMDYAVPSSRRDGRISREFEASQELPRPFFNATQLIESFASKALSMDEMVALSGAHSIGRTHCFSFTDRLYFFNDTHRQDPSINKAFARKLRAKCPRSSARDGSVALDAMTSILLDNVYYKNLISGKGVLTSDQTLLGNPLTAALVKDHAYHSAEWAKKFAKAMVHMGSIDVLTGTRGR